jgi:hydroxymethylbilane synthase
MVKAIMATTTATRTKTVTIGTRASPLALAQADRVAALIRERHPEYILRIHPITTGGDRIADWSRVRDETGIFVREIQAALRSGAVDFAVHSVKDMPSEDAAGLVLAAVPEREDPRDVLISRDGKKFHELAPGAVIGTSSVRRRAQILRRRPDLGVVDLRGNVGTRIRKVHEGTVAATVIAAAGMTRLGFAHLITEYLPFDWMLPAPCQGALGVEVRADDGTMRELAGEINDHVAFARVTAERAFMRWLDAGCRVPAAALAECRDGWLEMLGSIVDPATLEAVEAADRAPDFDAPALGMRVAERLLVAGGAGILRKVRS